LNGAGTAEIRLVNSTRDVVLADRVERAVAMGDRMRGLLGRSAFAQGDALVIAPCNAIHTFFMKFPIDAVFLDRGGRVVRALAEMRPWRATRFHFAASQVVELPAGTLARTGTRVGDQLIFRERSAV
jgi:uncharacterized protein